MRRAEQRDDGLAREVRRDEFEHEVERRRVRFGGERQCIERLIRNARVGKHRAGQIDVRQRPLENHRAPVER